MEWPESSPRVCVMSSLIDMQSQSKSLMPCGMPGRTARSKRKIVSVTLSGLFKDLLCTVLINSLCLLPNSCAIPTNFSVSTVPVAVAHFSNNNASVVAYNFTKRPNERHRNSAERIGRQLSLPSLQIEGNKQEVPLQNQQLALSLARAVVQRLTTSPSSENANALSSSPDVISSQNANNIWKFLSRFDQQQRRNMLQTALNFVKKVFYNGSIAKNEDVSKAAADRPINNGAVIADGDAANSTDVENAQRDQRSYGGGGYGGGCGGGCGGGGCGGGGCGGCCAQVSRNYLQTQQKKLWFSNTNFHTDSIFGEFWPRQWFIRRTSNTRFV